jgi:L-2,4-diaminobutyrate decarboxylase
VDGAHGASALLSPDYRHLMDGVELASSLTWDAHKTMQTPSVCAAVLVRDHRAIGTAFDQAASYLFHGKEQPGFDFFHRAVECTKSALGACSRTAVGPKPTLNRSARAHECKKF